MIDDRQITKTAKLKTELKTLNSIYLFIYVYIYVCIVYINNIYKAYIVYIYIYIYILYYIYILKDFYKQLQKIEWDLKPQPLNSVQTL